MLKQLKEARSKEGQSTLEYTVLMVIMLSVVIIFAPVFKKTLATMFKTQLDAMVDVVDESNNCCDAGDNRCRNLFRQEFCVNNGSGWVFSNTGRRCSPPMCMIVNMVCSVEDILEGDCN